MIAYTQVTPDHISARIYVNEIADAVRNLTAPLQGLPHRALQSNCSDLLASMSAAAAMSRDVSGDEWQPGPPDIAAVDSCLGELDPSSGVNATAALGGAAVKLLQAFIDSHGCVSISWVYSPAFLLATAETSIS